MAERQWTAAQKNAIEAKSGTVLVSAAAGSGKTSVLTERIVRRLTDGENGVRPDSLLVVTFTNAAAAEMRSRIYSGISAIMEHDAEEVHGLSVPLLRELSLGKTFKDNIDEIYHDIKNIFSKNNVKQYENLK